MSDQINSPRRDSVQFSVGNKAICPEWPNGPSTPRIQVSRGPKCPRGQRVPLSLEAKRRGARKSNDPPAAPMAGLTAPPSLSPPFPPPPQTSVQLPPRRSPPVSTLRETRAQEPKSPRAPDPKCSSLESGHAPSEPKCSSAKRGQSPRNPRAHSPSATTLPVASPVTTFAVAPPLLPGRVFDGNPL